MLRLFFCTEVGCGKQKKIEEKRIITVSEDMICFEQMLNI